MQNVALNHWALAMWMLKKYIRSTFIMFMNRRKKCQSCEVVFSLVTASANLHAERHNKKQQVQLFVKTVLLEVI